MKQFLVLFPIFFLLFYYAQAQNDSLNLNLPKTQWLSEDSLFLVNDSLPKPKQDSLSVAKKDTIIAPSSPLLRFKYISIAGIYDKKDKKNLYNEAKNIKDTLALKNLSFEWALRAKEKGKWDFSLEKYSINKDSLRLFFYEGNTYFIENITVNNLPTSYLQKFSLDKINKKPRIVSVFEIENSLKQIIYEYQKIGYPFAKFEALPADFQKKGQDSIFTRLQYNFEAGKSFVIDSIIFIGKRKEKNAFLYSMIRLKPKDTYNQEDIDNMQKILNNSIYFKNVKTPVTEFYANGNVKVRISLERKRVNKFDVLIGVLPPANVPNSTDQRLQWTGTADLALVSVIGYGESLQLKLEKLTQSSARINMKLNIPYIARLPLQANGEFELLKQTEDFLNLRAFAGIEYNLNPFLSVRGQYKYKSTAITDSLRNNIRSGKRKATILDSYQSLYNVGFKYENLDYRFNPKKGLWAILDLGLGQKIIKKDSRLPAAIFDTLVLNQRVIEAELWLKGYFSLSKRNVIHLANRTYYLDQKVIFQSDQMQLGGGRSIRGFNENQFFSDAFTSFTAEYRFILEQNSFLFAFSDYSILQDKVNNSQYYPIGIGFGMNYETSAGIVSFSYAVGKVGDIPFQPARGKIHIGLVSQF